MVVSSHFSTYNFGVLSHPPSIFNRSSHTLEQSSHLVLHGHADISPSEPALPDEEPAVIVGLVIQWHESAWPLFVSYRKGVYMTWKMDLDSQQKDLEGKGSRGFQAPLVEQCLLYKVRYTWWPGSCLCPSPRASLPLVGIHILPTLRCSPGGVMTFPKSLIEFGFCNRVGRERVRDNTLWHLSPQGSYRRS